MSLGADRSYKMKLRDVENAFKYRRIPYPKRSVELIALLAISCTFFLFMHTNKLNSRLKEMEVKLQPSEFSALGLTGNHVSGHDAGKHDDINTLHGTYQYLKSTGQLRGYNVHDRRSSEEEPSHGHHHDHHSNQHQHRAPHQAHLHKAAHDKQLALPEDKPLQQDEAHYGDDENDDDDDEEEADDEKLDGIDGIDGFNLQADLLNNTKYAEVDFVFFNRVPKVGSQSLMELMARLGKINGFNHARNKGSAHETVLMNKQHQNDLLSDLLTRPKPHIYSQHIAYINFTRFHLPRPIYINLVRDPIDRIISWHYYIRARWYYRDMQAKLGDKAPAMPADEFLDMDLDTCVRNHDPHCTFTQMQVKNEAGDHRRQTLFFCGMNQKLCMPFNSAVAMQKAKRTVESEYAVVGTWEDTNITLSVLEAYIPRYFRNAKVAYYLGKDRLSRVNRNNVTRIVSDETRMILRKNLTNEIEFYEFCKQRLYLQYAALSHGKGFGEDDYLLVPEQRNDYNEEY
ncbi:heparan sulfate 2-O-sulfotransferase pipe-like isoform X2 [Drosophila guanche]|uniref:Blast:Heparan sulfate 2-O-sulfotransferase pipe n=1 Tax=Drosophila guanche TaxID=7266 RepID=A0A3B0JZP9_DROGU|nr:heparan sulfate 2-O-sulfotransferase pipe-like isoform X2 [Drosophila guanche]SPP76578.1 blast:Heparan sulfate 2-O-sulfotransferase pipe [Drosophila guanche]